MKIVLITLAVLFALGVAAAVKGYYFLKDRVHEARQEMAREKSGPAQPTQAGCDILSKEKVSEILGVTIAGTKGNKPGDLLERCSYYTVPIADADEPDVKDLQSLTKKISSEMGHSPLLSVQIYRGNGATPVIAIKTVARLAGTADPSVSGPWDEAYFGPADASFAVRKGDDAVILTLAHIANKRAAGPEIAKAMIAGL